MNGQLYEPCDICGTEPVCSYCMYCEKHCICDDMTPIGQRLTYREVDALRRYIVEYGSPGLGGASLERLEDLRNGFYTDGDNLYAFFASYWDDGYYHRSFTLHSEDESGWPTDNAELIAALRRGSLTPEQRRFLGM